MPNDPYTVGAAQLLGKPAEQVTSAERAQFKAAFLMTLYNAGERKMLDEVYTDLEQRKREEDAKH